MDADKIFDAMSKMSSKVHRLDKIREQRKIVNRWSAEVCGNCVFWMTSNCKPEKVHKQFKSMSSIACSDFTRGDFTKKQITQETAKLVQMETTP